MVMTLNRTQVAILLAYGIVLWLIAAMFIRYFPGSLTSPVQGNIGFVTSILMCWLCVILGRSIAGLQRTQIIAGTSVACAAAMLLDASVLRWSSPVYSQSKDVLYLGASWLLWGYGVSLVVALIMSRPRGAASPVS